MLKNGLIHIFTFSFSCILFRIIASYTPWHICYSSYPHFPFMQRLHNTVRRFSGVWVCNEVREGHKDLATNLPGAPDQGSGVERGPVKQTWRHRGTKGLRDSCDLIKLCYFVSESIPSLSISTMSSQASSSAGEGTKLCVQRVRGFTAERFKTETQSNTFKEQKSGWTGIILWRFALNANTV